MERKTIIDGITGRIIELVPEQIWDIIAATFSILYLVVMLIVFSGLLFAILAGGSSHEDNPIYILMAYTAIGGGLGAIVNGIRSFISWHADRKAFGRRYVWKYISLPLLGATLAVMIYAFFRSGLVVFGGNFTPEENFANQVLAAFAIGAVSGYGSHRVLKWLDEQVKKLFKIAYMDTNAVGIKVPDLEGKTQEGLHEGNPTLKNIEKRAILDALHVAKGNREEAARLLEIGGRTLYRKMKEHGLTEERKHSTNQSPPTVAGQ